MGKCPKEDEKIKTTPCIIIFVAVDGDGRPEQTPSWVPTTQEDKDLEAYAKHLIDLRTSIQEEMGGR